MRYVATLAALIVCAGAWAAELPPPVAKVAAALRLPPEAVAVWVQGVEANEPLLATNAEAPMSPASTMKLVTTFAALEALTPAYTWETEAFVTARPAGGRVAGDLWIRGDGDPYFVVEEAWKFVSELVRRGVMTVEGDLGLDASRFDLPPIDRAAFDGQPDRLYNAIPHPFLVNFNAVRFLVRPDPPGQALVTLEPALPNLRVANRLTLGNGACTGFQRGVALAVDDEAVRDRAVLEGRFPAGCREFELARTVLQPASYAYGALKGLFEERGGTIVGSWRNGIVPAGLKPVYVHRSRPLGEIVRLVNKFSNNVMTLQLALTLGAERYGAPGTFEKGERAILDVLAERGVPSEGVVVGNPAGLSRESRISAARLGAVLRAAWRSPFMSEFVSSLSLNALDGTLRQRRIRGAPAGRMHLKTGRIDHVSAIAGYVTAASGRRYAAVAIVNAPGAHQGKGEQLQNALLAWVYQQ
jgi:D-alanyl-D-alanine carboxypeptidase/D-alanyl-D-alanine-endopeptidase (penicillin-binding protein 4)